jgi:plasmid stability protein
MFRKSVRFAVVVLASLALAPVALASVPEAISWHQSLSQAYQDAQTQHKPLVIYFYGEGSRDVYPACRMFEEGALASRELAAFRDRAVFVKVDVALDDSHGNVKKMMESLNVTELPTVAVVECREDSCIVDGQLIGCFETAEFVNNLRGYILRTTIEIRRAQYANLTEAELRALLVQQVQRVAEVSNAEQTLAASYRELKDRLLHHGEFDNAAFAQVAQAHNQAYRVVFDALADFAALPTEESRAMGELLLNLGVWEYDLRERMDQDLAAMCLGDTLPSYFVEKAQELVRGVDQEIEAEVLRQQGAVDQSTDKLIERVRQLASN